MRKSLTLTCAALLAATSSFALAQTSGAGVANSNTDAGGTAEAVTPPSPNYMSQPGGPPYSGRSSSDIYDDPVLQRKKTPSSDDAH
jgi:hypothetical protein